MTHCLPNRVLRLGRQLLVPALLAGTSLAAQAHALAGPASFLAWLDANDLPMPATAPHRAIKLGKSHPGQPLARATDTPPVAVAKNVTLQLDANGTASVTAAMVDNGSSDDSGAPALSVSPSTFTCANVGANTVTLTATDANGNVNTATATVTVQSALNLLETHTNVSCFGASNGSISLQVVAGNNATYAWTGPNGFAAATQNLTNVAAGTYTVVVNANGCSATKTITLTQPADQAPVANPDQLTTAACAPIVITPAMLLGNDTDPQGGTLQIAEVLTASSGTITANANGTYTYTPAPGFTGTATFNYVAKKNDATVAYSGNGHFYEFVAAPGICWTAARTAAAARTYRGLNGYLATITSAGENAFAAAKLQGNGWIGASDATTEGVWKWETGPETGQQFWQGRANGSALGYRSWASGEPNNSFGGQPEHYAHFYVGTGQWNDLPNCPGTSWISGYVVEYGGLESCIPTLTATSTVTVTVNGPVPTPTALAKNMSVTLSAAGTVSITAAQVNNGSNSPCGIASVTVSPTNFTCANVGPNTVTLTVTGAAGGVSTATATVTVQDGANPVARTKPATIYLDANGQASLSPADVDNNSSDNCSIATRTLSKSAFTCANVGPNTVTLTVTDASGRTATANAVVTVADNLAPLLNCRPFTVLLNAQGQASITAADVVASSSDNCTAPTLTVSPSTFTATQAGPNTVTVTARDAAGTTTTCQATVTVVEPAPVALCKPATVQLDANGSATISAADVDNGSFSLVGLSSLTVSPSTFSCANVGANTVTLTATSTLGRTATCQATVTVQDNIAPVAVAQNVTVQLDANGTASVTAAQVNNGSADNCAVATLALSKTSFTCADLGANTVTLTVTDVNGTASTATAVVTVADNVLPTISAPAAISVSTDAGQCTATGVALGSANAADNCSATVTNNAPAAFAKGTTSVTWTATDAAGNVATATQLVTVTDNELPVISAPAAVVASTDAGQCSATNVALGTPAVSDNCTGLTVRDDAPATFPKGTTTVTWTVTDASANVATATQLVTVNDNELPTITAPVAQLVSTDAGQCTATNMALGSPITADNCTAVTVTNDAPATFLKGATTVTWTATDAAGNTATATQLVTVNDTELPTISAPVAKVVLTDAGQCSATNVALGSAVAADNCSGVVVTNNAPSTFAKGETTVTWTATDASGNVATATQLVTVNDTERPVLAALPNLSVNAPATLCGAVARFAPTATDNCGATVTTLPASGSTFAVGTTTVQVTATDASGNTSTGSFTVTVRDVTAPTALAQNVSVTLVNGQATVTAAQVNNGSADACGIKTVSLSQTSFDCANIGANTVTLTVTDNHNLVSTATAVVTVRGDVPVVTIAATPASVNFSAKSVVIYLGYGAQTATLTASSGALSGVRYAWAAAPGLSTLTGASTTFTPTAEGLFTFTVTATSATGCSSTGTIKVYVEDVRCGNPNSNSLNEKVQLCHNGHTICVSINSLETHLGHGDKIGDCNVSFLRNAETPAPAAAATLTAVNELSAFPNPVTENATVLFRTAQDGPAQVIVYNELGQRAALLFDGPATAGQQYSLTLKGQNLTSGLYVCHLVANGKTQTLRLTVVR